MRRPFLAGEGRREDQVIKLTAAGRSSRKIVKDLQIRAGLIEA